MEFPGRRVLDAAAAVLSRLGRQGTRALAALIGIAIIMAPVGALLKPFVTEALFVLLCTALLRVDAAAFRSYLERPTIVLAATVWTSLVIPIVFGASSLAFGLKDLVLFVFVAAVMESVAPGFLGTPMTTVGLAALAFVVFSAALCLTTILFVSAGRERALTLGFMAAQRNVGLRLAATGGALPDLTWLYFAFCYFPIDLSPLLLRPLAHRIIAQGRTTPAPARRQAT